MEKCKAEGCSPVEQCRGAMGPGDYFGVRLASGELDVDHYLMVTPEEGHPSRKDIRIACSKCGLATPWGTVDLPNMPGIGRQYCVQQWDQMVKDRDQRSEMLRSMTEQFGAENVKKFFKHSL